MRGLHALALSLCLASASAQFDNDCDENAETAGLGELCDSDGEITDDNFKQCAETDGNANRLICDFKPFESTNVFANRFCLRRLADGESCSTENGACAESSLLRGAYCDDSNICRVEYDYSCNSDSDCDAADGEACILSESSGTLPGSADAFGCFKFSQQLGQECEQFTPVFGLQTLKCAEGLTCFMFDRDFKSRSVIGTCVTLAEDGEQCAQSQNVACAGAWVGNGPIVSACTDGICQPFSS